MDIILKVKIACLVLLIAKTVLKMHPINAQNANLVFISLEINARNVNLNWDISLKLINSVKNAMINVKPVQVPKLAIVMDVQIILIYKVILRFVVLVI